MTQPTVILAGEPAWATDISTKLAGEYQLLPITERSGYMKALIDSHAALILVDGDHDDWEAYTTTPKVSPATRRIPLILIAADSSVRADAALKGADMALHPAELMKSPTRIVRDYARVRTPEDIEQLDCECQEALPPLAIEGVRKFNAGEYYPQHDLFEEQWVKTTTPVRDLYRAILQVGVAYYQIERGNYRGALKMLQRSVQWLAILPDVCQGIDVVQLRKDSYRVRAELERLGEANFDQFDQSLLKKVKQVN